LRRSARPAASPISRSAADKSDRIGLAAGSRPTGAVKVKRRSLRWQVQKTTMEDYPVKKGVAPSAGLEAAIDAAVTRMESRIRGRQ
jgi:hypothetical protein